MCGIVGIFVKNNNLVLARSHVDAFKQMLYADALRGFDSTGVMSISDTGVTIHKDALPAQDFLKENPDYKWGIQKRALVGHNRWATRGKVIKENAHPFKEGHITLVHNGSLREHKSLKDVDVDSHAICHALATEKETKVLEKINGAYAIVWHDSKEDVLKATRNQERPLWLIECEHVYVLSSERKLADWILTRNEITVKKETLLEVGTLYEFKYNKNNKAFVTKKKYKPFVPPVVKLPPLPAKETTPVNNVYPFKKQGSLHYGFPFKEGDTIEVIPRSLQNLHYKAYALGNMKWTATYIKDTTIEVGIFTDNQSTEFKDVLTDVVVERIWWDPYLKKYTVIAKEPKFATLTEEYQVKKSGNDLAGILYTKNGIGLTNKTLSMVEDRHCQECGAPFEISTEIKLIPEIVNGKVYTYHYICPTCAPWYNKKETYDEIYY